MIDLTATNPNTRNFCEGQRANTIESYNAAIATAQARINERNKTLSLPTSTGNVMSAAGFGAASVSQYTKNQLIKSNAADQALISQYQSVISQAQLDYEVCIRKVQSVNTNCAQKTIDTKAMQNSQSLELKSNAMKARESVMILLTAQLKLSGSQADIVQKQIDSLQNMITTLTSQAEEILKRPIFVKGCSDPMSLKPDSFTY